MDIRFIEQRVEEYAVRCAGDRCVLQKSRTTK